MYSKKITFTLIILSLALTLTSGAETLRLGQSGSWQSVGSQQTPDYLEQIVKFKKLINQNKPNDLKKLTSQLKGQYPQFAGEDFNAFVEAEILFADENYLKAVKKYQEFLELYPQSDFYEPALERLYDIAVAFLNGQKVTRLKVLRLKAYEEAAAIMHNISEKAGNLPIGKRALITLAENYEQQGMYLQAYETWSEIYSRWPTSDTAQQALLGMARSLHSSYKGYKFNSQNLESAQSYYQDFKTRYPVQANQLEIKQQLALIEEQKAYKDYEIANFYEKTGEKQAAGLYYQAVIDQWPKSSAAQLAKDALRSMQTKKQEKRSIWDWWFDPKDKDNMFFIDLPDKQD